VYGDAEHKNHVTTAKKLRMQQMKEKAEQFDFIMGQFLDEVRNGQICVLRMP